MYPSVPSENINKSCAAATAAAAATKRCTACEEEKALSKFGKKSVSKDGLLAQCKACQSKRHKAYYEKNRERLKASAKTWRENNRERAKESRKQYLKKNKEKVRATNRKYNLKRKEKMKVYMKKYRKENKEKMQALQRKYRRKFPEKRREYVRNRRKTDPNYALRCVLRSRLRGVLRGQAKAASTMALLGCSTEQLMRHLERQFVEGMSWDNRGTAWHVDHILPCASFDLSNAEQQRRCFHWSNLQPLFAFNNLSKGDKILYDRKWTKEGWVNAMPS
tara:strand:+ start:1695 stop:2525 length:831 start_codon:yes stop_codon:yes gene_type:complete